MATSAQLSLEEAIGLGVAAALHVALAAALVLQRDPPEPLPVPERITVTMAEEVALQSASPDPASEAAASSAPTLSDIPEPEVAPPEAIPEPEPSVAPPPPRPTPRPTARPTQRPTATPTARPTTRPTARPTARPTSTPTARPTARPTPAPTSRPSSRPTGTATARPTATPTRAPGANRMGDDFLNGAGSNPSATGAPAATFGATERSALQSAITRQLRPHWSSPQGVDVELLVTVVRFRLNRDGRLAGTPTCTRQSGETPSNLPQKGVHCERAIRAVTLATPFNLPAQFYSQWDDLEWTFDRRL